MTTRAITVKTVVHVSKTVAPVTTTDTAAMATVDIWKHVAPVLVIADSVMNTVAMAPATTANRVCHVVRIADPVSRPNTVEMAPVITEKHVIPVAKTVCHVIMGTVGITPATMVRTATPVVMTVGRVVSIVETGYVIRAKTVVLANGIVGHVGSTVETGYVIRAKTVVLANGIVVHAQNSVVGLP